ncbi:hypothetical protein [uncultured Gelidibacter sp.]|uniref:hypothetical protein n=1 Tax=uncultured Gelidibacter sp. TaxID=259318 RepID=UPI00261A666D|nr:hypothetical protein [uncultured Gelidibacter sp.]
MNIRKYSIIVSLLVAFTFNNETIAQKTSTNDSASTLNNKDNILKFVVTKDTKDKQLNFITEKLSEKGATITFKDIERNAKNEITGIEINYDFNSKVGTYSKKLSQVIPSIEISINPSQKMINIEHQTSGLSQTIDIEINKNEDTDLSTPNSSSKADSFLILANKINANSTSKDTMFIQNTTDKVNFIHTIDDDGKTKAIRKTDHKEQIFNDEGKNPLIILNDKEISSEAMRTIDPNTIESITVLKNENATKSYGQKGKNGVIIINLKNTASTSESAKQPLYILEGKEITKTEMEAISPDDIESVAVLKDKAATAKYGTKGENGVIIIKTKKKN